MFILWLVIALIAAGCYFVAMRAEAFRWQAILKPIPIICMLAMLWPLSSGYAVAIAVGLVFSLIGDMALVVAKQKPHWFIYGLIGFLLAHLAYIVAYLGVSLALQMLPALVLAAYGVVMARLLWPHLGKMRGPVLLYMTVICTMVWRAVALLGVPSFGAMRATLAFAGAVSFAASDSFLAWDRFVRPLPRIGYVIMAFYWAGQLMITLSAATL